MFIEHLLYTRSYAMKKADNIQEQMNNVSEEMDILRKTQKKMLEIKHSSDVWFSNIFFPFSSFFHLLYGIL